jgi:hypothetical protein
MRAKIVVPMLLLLAIAACAHDERRAPAAPQREEAVRKAADVEPAPYVVADPGAAGLVALSLGDGALGIVVEKARIVTGRGEPKVAAEEPDGAIHGAVRIPARLGGGFLFWTDAELYRADTFDGPLQPIARVPEAIASVSFAPRFLLVRTQNGERWSLALPSGDRAPIDPLGVVDVEGLDDGRAIAFDDQGAVFASTDGGAHWVDATANVRTSPTRVGVVEQDVWLFESGGGAHRLEGDGRLTYFDKPPAEKAPQLRPRDPRWHGEAPPLRAAFHAGAAIDDTTAIVAAGGDIVRVDVRTGEISSVVPGRLPPDAICEAVPTASDVLFACTTRGGPSGPFGGAGGGAFVVARTLTGDAPIVEQSFAQAAPFYAGGDGGLAFAGPCGGAQSPPSSRDDAACVRQPGGTWQEVDASALSSDAGAPDVAVARWVPRADGRAVAIVVEPTPGIYDPRAGTLSPLPREARDVLGDGLGVGFGHHRGHARGGGVVDWSFTHAPSGALRGWLRRGGSVEVGEDGRITRSPWSFEVAASGDRAIGKTPDGRLFQSLDHGATWTEIAAPPSGGAAVDLRACSSAGCDLGGFYRVGWTARPPRADVARTVARPPPEVRRTKPVELACRPSGPAQIKVLARTERSPDDLGLGATRLPTAPPDKDDVAYVRTLVVRSLTNPVHDLSSSDADTPSLRGLLSGFSTERGSNDTIEVTGPNKNPVHLRRALSFVAPFDPAAPTKRASIAMSEVISAGRSIGMSSDEILSDDMTEQGTLVVVTPSDPNAPGDLVFHNPRGLVAFVRSNERVRVAVRPPQNEGVVVSGAALGGDEAALLEVESSGVGHVFKMASGGITDLFDVSPTLSDTDFYPANPDAVAIGPKNEVGILRTASGSDPASTLDPALLILPAMPKTALAPWSTLRLATDPECKRDPGWRATIQLVAPWIRVTAPELRAQGGLMLARVKWNENRVCLEGLEVRMPSVDLRIKDPSGGQDTQPLHTWLVERNGVFARIGIAEGAEWRQPMECSIVVAQPAASRR